MSGRGRVKSVHQGMIEIRNDNGENMHLVLASCSNVKATKQNHVLKIEDEI